MLLSCRAPPNHPHHLQLPQLQAKRVIVHKALRVSAPHHQHPIQHLEHYVQHSSSVAAAATGAPSHSISAQQHVHTSPTAIVARVLQVCSSCDLSSLLNVTNVIHHTCTNSPSISCCSRTGSTLSSAFSSAFASPSLLPTAHLPPTAGVASPPEALAPAAAAQQHPRHPNHSQQSWPTVGQAWPNPSCQTRFSGHTAGSCSVRPTGVSTTFSYSHSSRDPAGGAGCGALRGVCLVV